MQYFVYTIFSEKYNKYYIGQTNDFNQRLLRHNLGQNESTKPYRPWKLLLTIEKKSRAEAVQLEKKLKNLTKIRLNQFIIKNSNNNLSAGADDPDSVGMSAC